MEPARRAFALLGSDRDGALSHSPLSLLQGTFFESFSNDRSQIIVFLWLAYRPNREENPTANLQYFVCFHKRKLPSLHYQMFTSLAGVLTRKLKIVAYKTKHIGHLPSGPPERLQTLYLLEGRSCKLRPARAIFLCCFCIVINDFY